MVSSYGTRNASCAHARRSSVLPNARPSAARSEDELADHLEDPSIGRIGEAAADSHINFGLSDSAVPRQIQNVALLAVGQGVFQRARIDVVLQAKPVLAESAIGHFRRRLEARCTRASRNRLVEPQICNEVPTVQTISQDRNELDAPARSLARALDPRELEVDTPIESVVFVMRRHILQLGPISFQAARILA